MFGSWDFPTLKWKIALNLQWIRIAHYRKFKIAQLNAQIHCNSLQKLTLK